MNEREIFTAAIQIEDLEQRRTFVAVECGGDAALRRRVHGLLDAFDRAGAFLQQPIGDLGSAWPSDHPSSAGDPIADSATPAQRDAENETWREQLQVGGHVGPYQLLQKLGEGGMGQVWMAEQREPVRRIVALKVIGPGMDSRSILRRFEAERQALALMEHENIARVLDAGATATGRPYFVMELVKGIPITQYSDENQLDLSRRLSLFTEVCRAIQHAHLKGIIHRDIKPNNVLVAEYDGRPTVKVIDFGVAKAIHQPLTERSLFTQVGQLVGTLEYMSPEQARLNQLDIDTRSDVYSLGVLLYELLTGTTPFERQRLQEAAFDEMLRIIREVDPPRPSEKLSTSDKLPSVAANRNVEPARLNRLVRGELDWIVMKSLEKDRERRYDSASALAEDIHNYLSDRSVSASPPSLRYRITKFVRRHRFGVGVAAVLLLLSLAGVVSLWIERNRTLAEKNRAEANLQLAREALENAYLQIGERWHPADAESQRIREAFLREALGFYQKLARGNAAANDVGLDAAAAHFRVAQLHEQLSEWDAAAGEYQESIRQYAALNERQTLPWEAQQAWAFAHLAASPFAFRNGDLAAMRKLRLAALKIVDRFRKRQPNHWESDFAWIRIQRTIAYDLGTSGNAEEAEQRVREADAVCSAWLEKKLDRPEIQDEAVSIKGQLASLARAQKRWDEAAALRQEQLQRVEQLAAERNTPAAIGLLVQLQMETGLELEARGQNDRAQKLMDDAASNISHVVDQLGKLVDPSPETYKLLLDASAFFYRRGEYTRASMLSGGAINLAARIAAADPNDINLQDQLVSAHRSQASSLAADKKYQEALGVLAAPVEIFMRLRQKFPDNLDYVCRWAAAVDQLARTQLQAGQEVAALESWSSAEKELQAAADRFPRNAAVHNLLGRFRVNRAEQLIVQRQLPAGVELFRQALPPLANSVRLGDANFASVDGVIDAHLKYAYLAADNDAEVTSTLDATEEILKIAWEQFPQMAQFRESGSALLIGRANFATRHNDYIAACGFRAQAIEQMKMAAQLDPSQPQKYEQALASHYVEYARALDRAGRDAEALRVLAQVATGQLATGEQKCSAILLLDDLLKKMRQASGVADASAKEIEIAVEQGKSMLANVTEWEMRPVDARAVVWLLANAADPSWRDLSAAARIVEGTLKKQISLDDREFLIAGLAAAQYRGGDFAGCLRTLDAAAKESPFQSGRAFLIQAMALHQSGESAEAKRVRDLAVDKLGAKLSPQDQSLLDETTALLK